MSGWNIGYIRVSSVDQSTVRQLEGVTLDQVFEDKASGKDTNRPQLQQCLKTLRKGDHLHVHAMERLARNLVDLLTIVKSLTDRGVSVTFYTPSKMTFTGEKNIMADLMLAIIGAAAQFEREMSKERQLEGIAIAKREGKYKGRKPVLTPQKALELQHKASEGANKAALAREFGISRTSLYEYLNAESKAAAVRPRLIP